MIAVLPTEEWRDVIDWEGWYQASDQGRARSLDRILADGRRWRGRVLRPKYNAETGYYQVGLQNRTVEYRYIHELVLTTFVGPRPSSNHEACHWDNDRANNRLVNLRWDTKSGNKLDTVRHGTHRNASKSHCIHRHALAQFNLVPSALPARQCLACSRARANTKRHPELDFRARADWHYERITQDHEARATSQ